MKALHSRVLACLLAAGSTISAIAAEPAISVKVPFAFEVNGLELPAGAYTVRETDTSGVVSVSGSQGSALTESVPASSAPASHRGLFFERVNGKLVLIGVQLGSDARSVSIGRGLK